MSPDIAAGAPALKTGATQDGRYVVLAPLPQQLGKVRYQIRSQDDETIECIADESELSIA